MNDVVCPQAVPENRETVIAIQGGGIDALPMLGQARAILAAGYVPLGFAGNSGGAILAALLWAGLTPDRIARALEQKLGDNPDGLADLLLPRGHQARPYTLRALQALRDRAGELLPLPHNPWRGVRWLWRHWGAIAALQREVEPFWASRGVFTGERFQDLLESLLKEGLGIDKDGPVTFGDARRRSGPRPPLLLTATNVSFGCLELIDSMSGEYDKLSIAAAVRASAGVPGFFHPVDLVGIAAGRCFVDGGMVANFPLWAFSAAFREKLQRTDDYGWLAPRPWLPIGLRVREEAEYVDVSGTRAYLGRLGAIAAGMARNEMEDRLIAATLSHPLVVDQTPASLPKNPRTNRPLGFLDIEAVTADNIGQIVATGEAAANAALRAHPGFQVYRPECNEPVADCLEDLLIRCEHVMQAAPDRLNLRANIFMPVREELHMRFSARMTGHSDDGLRFPDLATGVNGWCYQARSPAICNLQTVAEIAARRGERPFHMSRELQARIRTDRSWLISFPIFDATERQPLRERPRGMPAVYDVALQRLQADAVGPILGMVNVDAGWNYQELRISPEPVMHIADRRIIALIDTVAQASLRLARLLVH